MLYFVSSNKRKFANAQRILKNHSIDIKNIDIPLLEIQSNFIKEIVLHKADQAFSTLNKPLLISDHGWEIPGLKGFPGPYMKYMNEWLTAQNFLDLTKNLTDRRIFLHEFVCFKNQTQTKIFKQTHTGVLLKTIQGDPDIDYPAMTICSFIPGLSEAEAIKSGKHSFNSEELWENFANWYEKVM